MAVEKYYTQGKPLVVFKWVEKNGKAPWGKGHWDFPKNGQRGAIRSIGYRTPIMCGQGIHGYPDVLSLMRGMRSARLFVAEIWGEVIHWQNEKAVGQHGCLCYELKLEGDPYAFAYDTYQKINKAFWSDGRMHSKKESTLESLLVEVRERLVKMQEAPGGFPSLNAERNRLNHP